MSIGFATLALLFSGWLIAESPSLLQPALFQHNVAAGFLVFGLVVRVVVFVTGSEHERLFSLFPAGSELAAMGQTIKFYIRLGRSSMPGWYAQNPLWKPVYLVIYLALAMLAMTGVLMPDASILLGFYLPSVHVFWAQVIFWFTMLHIASVIMHDYRNKTTDISAMVNGYRLFIVENRKNNPDADNTVQVISLDSMKKRS